MEDRRPKLALVQRIGAWLRAADFGQRIDLADAANGRFGEAALRREMGRRMAGLGRL